jgi:Acyl-CoA dehydrogenase, C-terminal domain
MDSAELELFAGTIRRAAHEGSGEALDAALTELGWHDALAADPRSAVRVLFEAQGAANATSFALDAVLAGALFGEAAGPAAAILPPLRRCDAPGRLRGGRLEVRGLSTGSSARGDRAVVVADSEDGPTAFALETAALEVRPLPGLDPALHLTEVTGELDESDAERGGAVDWAATVSLGHLALGHELLGAARAMLELARRHALDRVQFGRPISSFQAVRHRLADSLVAVEAADSLLAAAWDEPSPVTAAMAKALAGRSARTVARHAQQVLAGIGFTTEHPLQRYVRRTIVLDQLLGAGSVLTRQLGSDILRTGALPPAFPL